MLLRSLSNLTPEDREFRIVADLTRSIMRHMVSKNFDHGTVVFHCEEYAAQMGKPTNACCFTTDDVDQPNQVVARFGCTHPFYDSVGVITFLASCGGVSNVREDTCLVGRMQPPAWSSKKAPFSYGVAVLMSIQERAANARALERRLSEVMDIEEDV